LEENKLIESRFQEGKIVYVATSNGKKRFQSAFMAYKSAMRKMENFIKLNGEISP
jgi:DNA-binding PadR family transcriptional regulator